MKKITLFKIILYILLSNFVRDNIAYYHAQNCLLFIHLQDVFHENDGKLWWKLKQLPDILLS